MDPPAAAGAPAAEANPGGGEGRGRFPSLPTAGGTSPSEKQALGHLGRRGLEVSERFVGTESALGSEGVYLKSRISTGAG